MQRQVTFNRLPEKGPVKVWEAFMHTRSGSTGFRRGSGEGPGEGLGGFGAEPRQQGSGEGSREGSGEGLGGVRFNMVLEEVVVKVWEGLVQSQVGSNRVSEQVPGKVWEALVQSQVTFNRVPEKAGEGMGG